MLTYGDLLERGRAAFADGHLALAHYLLMAALYLAYTQGLVRGVRKARQQAVRQAEALARQEAPQATQQMAAFARGRAEFLLSRLELAQRERSDASRREDGA